jgi:hypothetical protein
MFATDAQVATAVSDSAALDGDKDSANELNTGSSLNGTAVEITDAGGTQSIELDEMFATDDQVTTAIDGIAGDVNVDAGGVSVIQDASVEENDLSFATATQVELDAVEDNAVTTVAVNEADTGATITTGDGAAVDVLGLATDSEVTTAIDGIIDGINGDVNVDDMGTSDIQPSVVGSMEVLDNSLTVDDLGTGSVGSDEVINNSLTDQDLGTNSVGQDEIRDESVGVGQLQDGAVTTQKILSGAVNTGIIANQQVFNEDLNTFEITAAQSITTNQLATDSELINASNALQTQITSNHAELATFSDDVVHLTGTQTVGGVKTFTNGIISDVTGNVTGNAATATKIATITNSNIVQLTATQTLTNKSLTSPTITGGSIDGIFTGNLTGDSEGVHTGDVTGNLTGDSAGVHTGDVTGNVTGNLVGKVIAPVVKITTLLNMPIYNFNPNAFSPNSNPLVGDVILVGQIPGMITPGDGLWYYNGATWVTNITSNDSDIATNASDIATNSTNIASNYSDIATTSTMQALNTAALGGLKLLRGTYDTNAGVMGVSSFNSVTQHNSGTTQVFYNSANFTNIPSVTVTPSNATFYTALTVTIKNITSQSVQFIIFDLANPTTPIHEGFSMQVIGN